MKNSLATIPLLITSSLLLTSVNISAQTVSSISSDSLPQTSKSISLSHGVLPGKNYLTARSIIIPVTFINYGFSSLISKPLKQVNKGIAHEVMEDASGFKTRVDDYLKYAPAAGVYLLSAVGIKGRHNILDRTIILAMSSLVSAQLVVMLKHATHQLRPDGSTYNSFPSGHTTTAFIGAEMMNQEFGWRSPWYSVAGYTLAAGTATLRIMNNRHWLSDVIAGAGLGMLSTKFSYWLYSKWENRRQKRQLAFY